MKPTRLTKRPCGIRGLMLAAFSLALAACSQGTAVINAADYGLKEGIDNTPALLRALQACKEQKAAKLLIPAGVYDIYPEKADEYYLNITNNDDGLKRVVFPLHDMKNFEIDGGGARFICHDQMVPFSVSGCENITLRNFSIDWAFPFFLQGQVVGVYPAQNAFDLKILDECRWEIQGDELVYSNKRTPTTTYWWFMAPPMQKDVIWEQNINWNIWYDPATKAPAFCKEWETFATLWNRKLNKRATAKDMGDNVVRLFDACEVLPDMDWVFVSVGIKNKNRLSPAICLTHCKDVLIEDVTVHHASGMALVCERSEDVTLKRYNVLLPPGSERLVTTGADATHFVSCKGLITLEDCVFENMLDDATNVHGIYAEIDGVVDSHTLGMNRGHSQHQGFDFAQPGERIALTNRFNLQGYDTLTVASVRDVNDFYFEVTFKESMDGRLKESSVAENLTCQPNFLMRGCEVRQNRARGILVSTAGECLVENNRFVKCTYAGIMTAGDANYWFESGPVRNLTIRNNYFADQGLAVGNAAVMHIVPEVDCRIDTNYYYHHNIVFENNTIDAFSRTLVNARSIKNFVFRNNTITRSTDYPAADPAEKTFILHNCRDVEISGNDYRWGPAATIGNVGSHNVVSANNKNIEEVTLK